MGFDLVGITNADPFPRQLKAVKERLQNGTMPEMILPFYPQLDEVEQYHDPRSTMPEARSIIVLGMRYLLAERHEGGTLERPKGRTSKDYWRNFYPEVRRRRSLLVDFLKVNGANAADENRVPTKAAAHRSGIGVYGKNSIIQNEEHGSWIMYTAITTDLPLEPDEPGEPRCGSCQRCIRLCPTKAIVEPFVIDMNRCLTLVLASPEPIPMDLRHAVGDRINSCDQCQQVCPRNEDVRTIDTVLPDPYGRWTKSPDLIDLLKIDEEEFERTFNGLEWLGGGKETLVRNAIVALGNIGWESAIPELEQIIASKNELLSEHAAWARDNILRRIEERDKGEDGAGTAI